MQKFLSLTGYVLVCLLGLGVAIVLSAWDNLRWYGRDLADYLVDCYQGFRELKNLPAHDTPTDWE